MTLITWQSIQSALDHHDPGTASPEGRIEAAVALVLVPGTVGPDLLLLRRATREGDPWSGQMGLPGGRRERRDADLAETAIRETLEETGIAVPSGSLVGRLDDLAPSIAQLPPMLVRPFVLRLSERPPIAANDEVALTLWTALGELESRRVIAPVTVPGGRRDVSGFRLGEHFVWGMTERILTGFLGLLAKQRGPQ